MSVLYSTDRPEFLERVASLAGRTSYRVPEGARGTKQDQLPDAHAIAAALGFARATNGIGADIAYCWATGTDAYKERATRELSVALRCHATRTHGHQRLAAAQIAWDVLIHNRRPTAGRPADVRQADWDRLLLAAIASLQSLAWTALDDAERAYRKSA